MKKIIVSAPGKLHLSGEHAVVYGKPAVLVSVSKRMFVTIESLQSSDHSHQSRIETMRKKDAYIDVITKIVEKKYQNRIENISVSITSDIPRGAGMGSSAALAVSLIGTLMAYIGQPWNVGVINELAYEAEKIKHENPSGGDNTVISYGGLLWFRKEFDFLKTFWLLPFKIPKSFLPLVLINTERQESTADMVKQVKREAKSDSTKFTQTLSEFEVATKQIVQAIHVENREKFDEGLQKNERLLEQIGVVSPSCMKLIAEIEKQGGVAKISGAGGRQKGSGVVICTHPQSGAIIEMAGKRSLPAFQVLLGGEGVRLEQVIS